MLSMSSSPVLIVGAGTTGLFLALWLSKLSISFRIIDVASGPGRTSRAIAVQPRSLEFYRQLGIADLILANGVREKAFRICQNGKVKGELRYAELGTGVTQYSFVFGIPQDVHERVLVQALKEQGVDVEWDTELVELKSQENTVTAKLQHKASDGGQRMTTTFTYILGCDGAHSAVRRLSNIDFQGDTYPLPLYVADVDATGKPLEESALSLHINRKEVDLCFPIRRPGHTRLIGVVPEKLVANDHLTFSDVGEQAAKDHVGLRVSNVTWFSVYRVHYRTASTFRRGNTFLVGDAGHIHSPLGGQGMNTGIGDAANLAWKVAATIKWAAPPEIFDTYETERMPFAKALVKVPDQMFGLMNSQSWRGVIIRLLIIPIVIPLLWKLIPGLRQRTWRTVSQLELNYRGSPLSSGHPLAGSRLPYIVFEDGSDNHEPLKSLAWQVHIYSDNGDQFLGDNTDLAKTLTKYDIALHIFPYNHSMKKEVGIQRNAVLLIRPDGYIGFAFNDSKDVKKQDDVTSFEMYCERWGVS